MRVLHVYSGNLYGGIEAMLAALARAGARRGDFTQQFALCFSGRLADELRAGGASVHMLGDVRLTRPASIRRARGALAGVLQTRRFDCVIAHAPWSYAMFAGIVRGAGVPVVFWAHDLMTGRHWTERLASRIPPDHVVCNSHFTRATLTQLFRNAPGSSVVYPPVEAAGAALSRATRAELRTALQTGGDAVVIATACRSEPWKGHSLLIDALGRLADVPGWVWWQIGGAQRPVERRYLASLYSLAERHGIAARVRWVGERTDVPRLLRASDVYCQTNTAPEPFGIAFVQALAAGLPVVTTDLGGAREIVDETCGVRVPAADPAALARAIRVLVTAPDARAALGAAAPARARFLCEPAVQLDSLAAVLTRLGQHAQAGAAS